MSIVGLICLTWQDTFPMRFPWQRYVQVVWMAPFARTVAGVLDEEEIRQLESRLAEYPRSGVVLSGTGGARKVRPPRDAAERQRAGDLLLRRGMRADLPAVRVSENVQASLTAEQARRVRALVEMLKAQDCHGNER